MLARILCGFEGHRGQAQGLLLKEWRRLKRSKKRAVKSIDGTSEFR